MAQNSTIEWTDHTFNPVRGCTKVSPGCANCYAARESKRFPNIRGVWGDSGTRIVAVPGAWKAPLRWNRDAERRRVMELHSVAPGVPHHFKRPRVFCASLADVFEDWQGDLRFPADIAPEGWVTARWNGHELVREFNETPMRADQRKATMDDLRTELFRIIEKTPNLDWQLLTKRPENVMRMVPTHWQEKFPANVWMGTTVEDQQRADERIPELLKIPAKVRFLSCEPLLGPVDLTFPGGGQIETPYWQRGNFWEVACENSCTFVGRESDLIEDPEQSDDDAAVNGTNYVCPECHFESSLVRRRLEDPEIHWVICGGESGPNARPMHPDWARSLRDQCNTAGVRFFFKQWGEWGPATEACGVEGSVMPQSGIMPCGKRAEWIGGDGKLQHPSAHGLVDPIMAIARMGKTRTGRLLDGREWNQMPNASMEAPNA